MAIEAMKAHKAVFVEKPLALTEDELLEVITSWKENSGQIMVGFNRRFAPLTGEAISIFQNRTQPLTINCRVNAGFIPKDHWIQDPAVGGGRIIGELCHFVDLIQFIVGSHPLRVFAESISTDSDSIVDNDNMSVSIKFADGSLGTILYTAGGDTTFPKERIEIFGEGSVAAINDFKRLELVKGGKIKKIKRRRQNKGHKEELEVFIRAVKEGGEMPIAFKDIVITTFLTFMIERSLRERMPLDIDPEQFGI
jgi:polar amino acid transport system substrate-binding protein